MFNRYNHDVYHSGVGHDDNPPGRGSGLYPWGSGENPFQREFTFLSEVRRLRDEGLTDAHIAKVLLGDDAKTTDLRAEYSIQTKQKWSNDRMKALILLDECHGNVSEVGRRMGYGESKVRLLLKEDLAEKNDRYHNTAEFLKKRINEAGIIDISSQSELYINNGVTDYTKKVAVAMLEKEGYVKSWVKIPQMGTKNETTVLVLAKPGTTHKEIQEQKFNIKPIVDFTPDEGKTWWAPEFPTSIDSKRVHIKYKEDGGADMDGVIQIRPGVKDLDLGGATYSQVRIGVDGTHYLKGMAVYSDDIPKGYDISYNTNKKRGTPAMSDDPDASQVFKPMKIDKETGEVDRDNPFGAALRVPKERDGILTAGGQRRYMDKDGNMQLSAINKINDEGDWQYWSKNLASQFLSKQPLKLINQQIDITLRDKEVEYEKIHKLTNPQIKKKMLQDFADACDRQAVDLCAKGFKDQAYQVLLPVPDIKPGEIYAPNYSNGERVALVRYPHGGIFEIPTLKVNNRSPEAKKILGLTKDAVGIHPSVAEILSGADFDGDAVTVIPLDRNRITLSTHKPLEELKNFDHKLLYKLPPEAPKIKHKTMQTEMGKVSNLITDMTVAHAPLEHIALAVKHSMVVIDSEKHHLNYKKSEKDNNIIELKKTYQGVNRRGQVKGASTIISKSRSSDHIPKRKEVTDVNKMTPEERKRFEKGYKIYHDSGKTKKKQIKDKKTGEILGFKEEIITEEVPRMSLVDDAFDLVRDPKNDKEIAYANYANDLKRLALDARRESRNIKPTQVSKEAKLTYAEELQSIDMKIRNAESNNPRERIAQAIANAAVFPKFKSNPDMTYEEKQKRRAMEIVKARNMVGAHKDRIVLTDKEWEAIQAGAVSTNKMNKVIKNSDLDQLKMRAMPKRTNVLSDAEKSLIQTMKNSERYTIKEIAEKIGVSVTTIQNALN